MDWRIRAQDSLAGARLAIRLRAAGLARDRTQLVASPGTCVSRLRPTIGFVPEMQAFTVIVSEGGLFYLVC